MGPRTARGRQKGLRDRDVRTRDVAGARVAVSQAEGGRQGHQRLRAVRHLSTMQPHPGDWSQAQVTKAKVRCLRLEPKSGTSRKHETRAQDLGPKGPPRSRTQGKMYIKTFTSRGGVPPLLVKSNTPCISNRGDTWNVHVPRRDKPTLKSPTTRVAVKANYKFYISRGGSPEAAVDGAASLRPRGSKGQLTFLRAFPP